MTMVRWLDAPVDVPSLGRTINTGDTFELPEAEALARAEAGQVEIVTESKGGKRPKGDD